MPRGALDHVDAAPRSRALHGLARGAGNARDPLRCRRRRAPVHSPPAACVSRMGAPSPTVPTRSTGHPSGGCRRRPHGGSLGSTTSLRMGSRRSTRSCGASPLATGAPRSGSASRCARPGVQVQARGGPPVAEQPRLDVLERQRLAQQRVAEQLELDLPDGEIVRRAPPRDEAAQLVLGERRLGRGGRGRLDHGAEPNQPRRMTIGSNRGRSSGKATEVRASFRWRRSRRRRGRS
jgi:hypothetical protein